ncbi:MAG: hypothetical protein EZS28_048069 [Streblomastix strix]|uniref:Protein kinase domain-containing protein n=1 Tax=Streblomastix strix TaxID=222440 RepID=A0A5J4TDB9_9EUKA|nr:MAG: hypothetical protein EZS28_048069 [Streblomastix strix]
MQNIQLKGQKQHVWSDFEYIKELSSGAFGCVLQMRLKESGDVVIIKRLPYVNPEQKRMADEEVEINFSVLSWNFVLKTFEMKWIMK